MYRQREEQPPRSSDDREQVEDRHSSGENRPYENLRQRLSPEFYQIDEEPQHSEEAKNSEQQKSQASKRNIAEVFVRSSMRGGTPCHRVPTYTTGVRLERAPQCSPTPAVRS